MLVVIGVARSSDVQFQSSVAIKNRFLIEI